MRIQSLFLKIREILWLYRWPILSGLLIGTSYIPFPPWAILFCLVPLFIFWDECKSAKQAFWGGWCTNFILTLIGFNWVAYLAKEFGHFPWPLAIVTLLLFCAIANVYFGVAGALYVFINKRLRLNLLNRVLAMAFLVAICETFYFLLFKWNFGYSLLWANLNSYQVAELIGFQGLSSLIILSNVPTFFIWKYRRKKIALKYLAVLILGWGVLEGAGYYLKSRLEKPDKKLRVLVTQANIGNLEKVYAEKGWGFRDYVISKYFQLTSLMLNTDPEPVDFILWPETAYPASLGEKDRGKKHAVQLREFIRRHQTPVVTGGYGWHKDQGKVTNSIFFFSEKGPDFSLPYHKEILLAFGEFIPLADKFPFLKKLIPAGDFARGEGPTAVNFKDLKLGPFICYEGLYPNYIREIAEKGAHILVNSTNDSWYGTWMEPFQHGYMTLARAIELRLPLIRSTNTGISMVILADGTILEKSPQDKEWSHIYEVPYHSSPTPTLFQRYYWLFPGIMILLFFILLARGWFGRARDH